MPKDETGVHNNFFGQMPEMPWKKLQLFIIKLSEPSMVTRGLFAIVKARNLDEAKQKVSHLDQTVPAEMIAYIDFMSLGSLDSLEYVVFEYYD